jgi:hypothetical protein
MIQRTSACALVVCVVGIASLAAAQPVVLKDSNGTKYTINTTVIPPPAAPSEASGALADATYVQPVTVTDTFVGVTSIFGFATVFTTQFTVNVPLTNAFAGFNGLVISGDNGVKLATPILYNPGAAVASQDCPQNGTNRQLNFQPQMLPAQGLQVTRSVYIPNSSPWVRWLNVVTNTGAAPSEVGITLVGRLGSGSSTKVTSSSSGDSVLTTADLWFTTAQSVPQGTHTTQPAIGFVVQGAGATTPAKNLALNTSGQAGFTFAPTIAPGASAIVMTFVTVQGNKKQVKNTVTNLVDLPSGSLACLSEAQLKQVVNFAPITPPTTKSATITLKFNKAGQDTVQWKGSLAIGAGISLAGQTVTIDIAGVVTTFVLSKSGSANNGGGNKFSLGASLKNGVTKAGNVNFSFNLKGDYQTALAPYGLTNATQSNVAVTVPAVFTAGPGRFSTDQPFTYKATAGKTGTAKASS